METPTLRWNPQYFTARDACPVCRSRETTVLHASPYGKDPVRSFLLSHYKGQGEVDFGCLEGTDFVISECNRCGMIYQRHVPNGIMLEKVYNEMISQVTLFPREMRSLTITSFEFVAGELTELFALVRKHPTEVRFLDYGFGYGAWSRVAVALGAQVYATEISPEKIAFGESIGVRMVAEDELAAMQFDIVHTEQVFEHLTEPRAAFAKLAGLVAPGGIMKLAVPPAGNIRTLLKTRGMAAVSPLESDWQSPAERQAARRHAGYMCIVPLEHLNVFTRRGIDILRSEAGLQLIGTVRRQAVPVSTSGPRRFLESAKQLVRVTARVVLRSALRQDSGYYILRRG